MKILIITQYFFPENFRINDLSIGLKEKGHDVIVLTGIPNYPHGRIYPGYKLFQVKTENYHGIKIIRAPLIPRGKSKSINLILNYLSFALFASIVALFRCREKYDAIFIFEPSPITVAIPAIILKKIKKIRTILWVQDLWPESLMATKAIKASIVLNLVNKLVKYIYKNTNKILVSSKGFIPNITKMGVEIDKIQYFPNWAEEVYSESDKKIADNFISLPDGFRIMFAGNIGVAQDFETILAAAERLKKNKSIHWIIVGDGRMLNWLKKETNKRSLLSIFHLLGRHPIESMPKFFALADVMLVSLKKELIFSLTVPAKVQSYMACGKPIIASLDGEGSKIIEESGCGLTCPAENPEALANTILSMYKIAKKERKTMGNRGKKYFKENFNRKYLIDQLDILMMELIKN